MKLNKLMTMPSHLIILIWIGCMTSMITLFEIIGAVVGGSYNESMEFMVISLTITIIAWGMFYYQRSLTKNNKFPKLVVVVYLYLIMTAITIYNPELFTQMWVLLILFPIMSSLLTKGKEYAYYSLFFLVYFIIYISFGPSEPGVEADAVVLSAIIRISLALGSVLLGSIIIMVRYQQRKELEDRALQQQKQQLINMLQCFIPVGERKTQTSRKEISEMSMLLKALWAEYGGKRNYDWEIDLLSLLHFVSRVKLPDYMFEKEGKLSEFELEVVQEHCYMAKELCEGVPGFLEVQSIFLYHHEKVDGTGYPYRLNEEQIPNLSQMLGLVEVFLAMTTPRSYRQAMSEREAYDEIRKLEGASFRVDIVAAFGRVII